MNARAKVPNRPLPGQLAGLAFGARGGVFLIAVAAVASAGCGGAEANTSVSNAKLPTGTRPEAIEHEACEDSGHRVELLDATGDGKPDIKRVYDSKSNREVCRTSDLDHDGKPDLFEYYDASGALRRREGVFDDGGVVNLIEYYEGGKLVRKELDTTGQHRIDTWDFFDAASGKRVRRERDSTNDGRVDQWWTWEGEKVTITIDKNGDGKPDPEATVIIGGTGDKDGGAPASSAPPPPAPPEAPSMAAPAGSPGDAGAAPTADSGSSGSAKQGGTTK